MSTLAPQAEASSNRSSFRGPVSLIVFGVFVCSAVLSVVGVLFVLVVGHSATNHDFASYWAAGQQLVHGANPYNAGAISELQRTAGFRVTARAFVMRNPPTALFLVVPLGLLGVRAGSIVWSVWILGCLAGSIHLMWRMNGSPPGKLYLLGYLFAPTLMCFAMGQTSIFVLLGLCLFLRFHESRPWLAGVALSLCALKPHLFLPFAVVLCAWVVTRKAYRILAGAAVAMGVCCVIPLCFDPSVWRQYIQMAHVSGIQSEFMPDLGTMLRFGVDRGAMWLQFLPALAGCVWALWYFLRHREDWDWQTHGSLLLLVSVGVAPYSWFFDQVILLPALVRGLYSGRSLVVFLALVSITLIELFFGVSLHSALYSWPAGAWLVWYLWPAWDRPGSPSLPEAVAL